MCQVCFETVIVFFKTTCNISIIPDLLISFFWLYDSPRLKSRTKVSAKSPSVNMVLRQNFAETKVLTLRLDLSLRPG